VKGTPEEKFENLSMNPAHSRYFRNVVDSTNVEITLADPPSPTQPPDNLPSPLTRKLYDPTQPDPGTEGKIDKIKDIQPKNYRDGIDALEKVDEVNILCVPDSAAFKSATDTQDVQTHMIDH